MTDIEIKVIDAADEVLLKQWWSVRDQANKHRPARVMPGWEATRQRYGARAPEYDTVLLGAFAGGPDTMVGGARLMLHRKGNPHMANGGIDVLPQYRRKRVGSTLLDELERHARADGRTHLVCAAHTPPGVESGGALFATACGFEQANVDQLKVLDLREYGAHLDALAADAGPRDGYRIELYHDTAPKHLVQGVCDLLSGFFGEIPTGDLVIEDSPWTPERLRAVEQALREQGTLPITAVAVAPDGAVAGVSDLAVPAGETSADIGVTVVAREHRGHGLGLAMKLASHNELRAAYPECAAVITGNAAVNTHMNAVNERMGYRVVEDAYELQKEL